MRIVVNNKAFDRAFTISPTGLKNLDFDHLLIDRGIYIVMYRNTIEYIGKFTNTLRDRWINLDRNSNCVRRYRHQKGSIIQEKVSSSGHCAHVLVRYVSNPEPLEVSLIKKYRPRLNIQHNR